MNSSAQPVVKPMKHSAILVAIFVFAIFAPPGPLPSCDAAQPNILFILADDQSPFDLKLYNADSSLDTPVLDRIATEGMVFDAAYHMGANVGAVCTPSRHMIMSGRTLWHLPTAPGAIERGLCPADLPQHTLPAVFNAAGYKTMRTCKLGNSYEAANQLFTIRRDATKRGGTDDSGSAWHADQVIAYLDERRTAGEREPFLIYFGFSHPHDPREAPPELAAKYGATNHQKSPPPEPPPANDLQPRLPNNYLLAHPFHHGHPGLRDEESVHGVWGNRDERTIRNEIGLQFACSENIDIQIGRVLEKLEQSGELDNTYIIYTADHGMAIGRHGLQGKQNLYEHTWRVPLIVKGPGIAAGSRVQGNVYLLDMLATLCDLAGIASPSTNEGMSFKPVLMGQQETIRDTLYGVYNGGTKPGMRSVRNGDWKLIKYDVLDGEVRQTQLFNLAENPDELLLEHHEPSALAKTGAQPRQHQVNLAGRAEYADKLAEMESLLLSQMRELDDPYRLWDQPDDQLPTPPVQPRPRRAANRR
jgi:choline-sulfatase